MNKFAVGRVVWHMSDIKKEASQQKRLLVIYNNVYDVSTYFATTNKPFGTAFDGIFTSEVGTDATSSFEKLFDNPLVGETKVRNVMSCMNEMFYIGSIIGTTTKPSSAVSLISTALAPFAAALML
jgi:cytochrome b involved in lipid metabolism